VEDRVNLRRMQSAPMSSTSHHRAREFQDTAETGSVLNASYGEQAAVGPA